MKLEPAAPNAILGHIIDINVSRDGILALPTNEGRANTMMVRVDAVGAGVQRCKVGDIIVHLKCNHVLFRDGSHWIHVLDEDVHFVVKDVDPTRIEEKPQIASPVLRDPRMRNAPAVG